MAIKPVYLIGTVLYYCGLVVMLLGMITFVFGMMSSVSSVMGQVKSMSSGTSNSCLTLDCVTANQTQEQDLTSEITSGAGNVLGGYVDEFFAVAGLSSLANDPTSAPIYSKARNFFAMLALGLSMVVLGTLMRLLESVVDYFDGRGKKQEMAQRYRISWGARAKESLRNAMNDYD